jgi:hypothetical protein
VWRRAAIVALIGIIAVFAMKEDNPFGRWKGAIVAKPEIAVSALFESIPIFQPSIQIDCSRLLIDIINFNLCQRPAMPHNFGHNSIYPDGSVKFLFQFRGDQIRFAGLLRYFDLSPTHDFIRGGLPVVLKVQYDSNFVSVGWKRRIKHHSLEDTGVTREDISSQLASSIAHHDPYRDNESNKLEESSRAGDASYSVAETPASEPTIAPLFWSFGSVGLGFILSLRGLFYFDDEKRLVGGLLLGCGLLLGAWRFLLVVL